MLVVKKRRSFKSPCWCVNCPFEHFIETSCPWGVTKRTLTEDRTLRWPFIFPNCPLKPLLHLHLMSWQGTCPWRLDRTERAGDSINVSTFKLMLVITLLFFSAMVATLHWSPDREIYLLLFFFTCHTCTGSPGRLQSSNPMISGLWVKQQCQLPCCQTGDLTDMRGFSTKEEKCLLCQWALLVLVCLINAAEGSLLMHKSMDSTGPSGWRWMALTYYHSFGKTLTYLWHFRHRRL